MSARAFGLRTLLLLAAATIAAALFFAPLGEPAPRDGMAQSSQPVPVGQVLAPIMNKLIMILGYDPLNALDPWKLFDTQAPSYVNDLQYLETGKGYWVKVSEPAQLYGLINLLPGWNLVAFPPALFGPEPTPVPFPTPISEPPAPGSVSPQPQRWASLFAEDFEQGEAQRWQLGPGWERVREQNNFTLRGSQHSFANVIREEIPGTATAVQVGIRVVRGGLHINFRTSPAPSGLLRYFLGVEEGGLDLQKQSGADFQALARSPIGITLGHWHTIRIEMRDGVILAFLDGAQVLTVSDSNPILQGGVSFETLESSEAFIDNVTVEGIPFPAAIELSVLPTGVQPGSAVSIVVRITPAFEGETLSISVNGPQVASFAPATHLGYASTSFIPEQEGDYRVEARWAGGRATAPVYASTAFSVVPRVEKPAMVTGSVHQGDLIVEEGEKLLIQGTRHRQQGDLIVRGKLVIRNAVLELRYREKPQVNIFVEEDGTIELDGAAIDTDWQPAHFLNMGGRGLFHAVDSQINTKVFPRGSSFLRILRSSIGSGQYDDGDIGVSEQAQAIITDSTTNAVTLRFLEAGSEAQLTGLRPGFFPHWSLAENATTRGIRYSLVLDNVRIREKTSQQALQFTWEWSIMATDEAKLNIKDSQINFVMLNLRSNAAFEGLRPGVPLNLRHQDIVFENTALLGQFGVNAHNASVSFRNSQNVWVFCDGAGEIALENSTMTEFDPRDFRGVIRFQGSTWAYTGEILFNNDFSWVGDTRFWEIGFQERGEGSVTWHSSRVTREYRAMVQRGGTPLSGVGLTLSKDNQVLWRGTSNERGEAIFTIAFTDDNHTGRWLLSAEGLGVATPIGFFTDTPILLEAAGG